LSALRPFTSGMGVIGSGQLLLEAIAAKHRKNADKTYFNNVFHYQ
jgi:hypothetical protein